MANGDHVGPVQDRVAPDDGAALRALAAEQRARLDVVRHNGIWDWLGGEWSGLRNPKAVLHGIWLQLAFVGLAAIALVVAGFTRGPVLWGFVVAAAVCLSLRELLLAAPMRRTRRFFRRGVIWPAVVVAHAPVGGTAAGRAHRLVAIVGRGELTPAALAALVAAGDRLRHMVDGGNGVSPELADVVSAIRRAVPEHFDGRRQPLPSRSTAAASELAQLEVPTACLPDGAWSSRLLFVFADPERRAAGSTRVVQSSLWGGGAASLCAAFPFEVHA